MIQYELFLKEISDFLRSCTIKNKYFAQNVADQVIAKYGFSELPDKFNPYYLRMCGLSTLDLKIPRYLVDEDGNRTYNEDHKYASITDPNPELTRLIMVRLDLMKGSNGLPLPAPIKIEKGVETIKEQIAIEFATNVGVRNVDGKKYTGKAKVFVLEDVPVSGATPQTSKIKDLHNKIANLNSNDNGVVINIITGTLSWDDFVSNSISFSENVGEEDRDPIAFSIQSRTDLTAELLQQHADKLYLNVTSEKKTYTKIDNTWREINQATMFAIETVAYCRRNEGIADFNISINDYNRSANINFFTSKTQPPVEALVVIGATDLDWLNMYYGYTENGVLYKSSVLEDIGRTIYNIDRTGDVIDVPYSKINEALGYTEAERPPAGSRINYIRHARAWRKGTDSIIYTEKEQPEQNDTVYDSDNLGSKTNWKVVEFTTNPTNSWIKINDINDSEYVRSSVDDVVITCGTYMFNGLDWASIDVRDLFDEEWKKRFSEEFSIYDNFTYTTMSNPFDKESFDEKLIVGDNNDLFIDRYEYLGWDKPVYIPTYDYINELTRDFTLYTRLFNHMKDNHVKTALKYHIGAEVYNTACENYTDRIDFIKGVCYPVHNLLDQLEYEIVNDVNGTPMLTATQEGYRNYIKKIEDAASDIASKKNFTLLNYDSTLLKENEADSLINALTQTLTCVRERWDVGEFGYEELYYPAVWATIWSHLPFILFVQRILNLRTEAVHVDHIWEYLESKGLKDYRTVMDMDQQVFLYKNMEYLRGNEGKQSTLRILVDKLLSKFGATVNTKSVLLDTTLAKENKETDLYNGTHNINGLTESVSASVKILSEDLDEQTSVIRDTQGRIEDFDETYRREYNSGLEPYYGGTQAEQMQRVATAHDEIEIKRHTYAPPKLAEITQKGLPSDVTRLAMAFIFQTLIRKMSGNEILPTCVVNVMFTGLSTPKTFSISECIALIFYALRKSEWYTYKNKYGEQNKSQDIWKSLTDAEGNGLSLSEHKALIDRLMSYENCPKTNNPSYESDCDHIYFNPNETFNDFIPRRASLWLPYLGPYSIHERDADGNYVKDNEGNFVLNRVEVSIPMGDVNLNNFIYMEENRNGDLEEKSIKIADGTMASNTTERPISLIVSPTEYNSLELQSWNDMVSAENSTANDTRTYTHWEYGWDETTRSYKTIVVNDKLMPDSVVSKYDICTDETRIESIKFVSVPSTLVGGIISGSSRSVSDNWYMPRLKDIEISVRNHTELMNTLSKQANFMINHFQMTRNSVDAYFHRAMDYIYKKITVVADVALDLVPGHTTYTDWFETDIELKSVFRDIEEGADQAIVYNSIADSFIEALFPADKLTLTGSVNQTKYAAMKELFQWLGSYNLAYLNASSVQYETLFLHPITINATFQKGINNRPWIVNHDFIFDDRKISCCIDANLNHYRHYGIRTSELRNFSVDIDFTTFKHVSEWNVINTGWSMTTTDESKKHQYVKSVTPHTYDWSSSNREILLKELKSAMLLYGYETVAEYDETNRTWVNPQGAAYTPNNQSIVLNKTTGVISIYSSSGNYENCSIIDINDVSVFEWDTIPSEHFKVIKHGKTISNMFTNFVYTWTSNSNPENDAEGWNNSNADLRYGSKSYIGTAQYETITLPSGNVAKNDYRQVSVNYTPSVIKFNN